MWHGETLETHLSTNGTAVARWEDSQTSVSDPGVRPVCGRTVTVVWGRRGHMFAVGGRKEKVNFVFGLTF